jgi:hypothetical protein
MHNLSPGHMTGFEQVRSGSPLDSAEHECEAGEQLAPLLLVTTVDIGDGQSDKIEVRQGDVPLDVAHAFVTKHSLPPAVVPRLATHLEENLLKVAEQLRAAVSADAAHQTHTSDPAPGSCCIVGQDLCWACSKATVTATYDPTAEQACRTTWYCWWLMTVAHCMTELTVRACVLVCMLQGCGSPGSPEDDG